MPHPETLLVSRDRTRQILRSQMRFVWSRRSSGIPRQSFPKVPFRRLDPWICLTRRHFWLVETWSRRSSGIPRQGFPKVPFRRLDPWICLTRRHFWLVETTPHTQTKPSQDSRLAVLDILRYSTSATLGSFPCASTRQIIVRKGPSGKPRTD
jgi:hypothetical protein